MCGADQRFEVLLDFVRGNVAAAEFLEVMYEVAHVWDDLIDQDESVAPERVSRAFYDLLMVLPRNEFYSSNFEYLNPIVGNSVTNWHVATRLEREGDEYEKHIAFILRSSYVDLIVQCATLIGGVEYGVEVGVKARRIIHAEGWAVYLENLAAEEAARANLKE